MFKKLKYYAYSFFILWAFLTPYFGISYNAYADMSPKVKTLGTMALYGTASGALLGSASLVFGAKGRSVAIGASLGLYAGLIFGTYVIASHEMSKNRSYDYEDGSYYPEPVETPYESQGNDGEDGYYNLWNPYDMPEMKIDIERIHRGLKLSHEFNKLEGPTYYLQLLRFEF